MDSVFGFVGDGYCIIGADAAAARSIVVFQHDHDKIMELDDCKLLGKSGTPADNDVFSEYIQKNMKLYQLNNDLSLNTAAAANFMRNEVREWKSYVEYTHGVNSNKHECFEIKVGNRIEKGSISNKYFTG